MLYINNHGLADAGGMAFLWGEGRAGAEAGQVLPLLTRHALSVSAAA